MKDEHEQGYVYTELLICTLIMVMLSGSPAFVLHDFKEAAVRKQFEADTNRVLAIMLNERIRVMAGTPKETALSRIYFTEDTIYVTAPDADGNVKSIQYSFGSRLKIRAYFGSNAGKEIIFKLSGSISQAGNIIFNSADGKLKRELIVQPVNSLIYLKPVETV